MFALKFMIWQVQLIKDVVDRPFDAGQQRIEWNGITNEGLQVGNGFYMVTFESQLFTDWKKLIIVR